MSSFTGDLRRTEQPRVVAVQPRQRFSVIDLDGVRHSLDPTRDRVALDHPWVLQRPELWEPEDRMEGQSKKVYGEAAARTRAQLSRMCAAEATSLERGTTRTADPDRAARTTSRPLRLP